MNVIDGFILSGKIINPVSTELAEFWDAAIAIDSRSGIIRNLGSLQEMKRKFSKWNVAKLDDSVILPAFSDAHTHLPQFQVRHSSKAILYKWLDEIVFPEEKRFVDGEYATKIAVDFFQGLVKNGTLNAVIFLSPFFETISSISQLPVGLNQIKFHAGPILMNNGNKFNFETDTDTIIKNVEKTATWMNEKFAISPRYAPICDAKLLKSLGEIASKHNLLIQTHLGELPDEFEKTKNNFPRAKQYTEIFEDAGLLTNRTIFGHCLYLDDADFEAIADAKALVAHLPIANEALSSGRMPLEKLREFGVNWALGTDVGASPTLSMLAVMQSFLRTHEKHTRVTAVEALYRATRTLPEFLGLKNYGTIKSGAPANLVVVESPESVGMKDAEHALRNIITGSIDELETKVTATIANGKTIVSSIPSLIP